jgi:hypothetical protein
VPPVRRDLPLPLRLAAATVVAQALAGIAGAALAIAAALYAGWRLGAPLLLVAGATLIGASVLAGFAGLLAAGLGLRGSLPWARPVAVTAQALAALAGAAAVARGVAAGLAPLLLGAVVIAGLSTPAARAPHSRARPGARARRPRPRHPSSPIGRPAPAPLPPAAAAPHRAAWWELAGFGLPRSEPRP